MYRRMEFTALYEKAEKIMPENINAGYALNKRTNLVDGCTSVLHLDHDCGVRFISSPLWDKISDPAVSPEL